MDATRATTRAAAAAADAAPPLATATPGTDAADEVTPAGAAAAVATATTGAEAAGATAPNSDSEDSEMIDPPAHVRLEDTLVGARVSCTQDGCVFHGTVTGVDQGRRTGGLYYLVTYDDGDCQHFSALKVAALVAGPLAAGCAGSSGDACATDADAPGTCAADVNAVEAEAPTTAPLAHSTPPEPNATESASELEEGELPPTPPRVPLRDGTAALGPTAAVGSSLPPSGPTAGPIVALADLQTRISDTRRAP